MLTSSNVQKRACWYLPQRSAHVGVPAKLRYVRHLIDIHLFISFLQYAWNFPITHVDLPQSTESAHVGVPANVKKLKEVNSRNI
jgi:hypothetical protein